MTATHVLPLTNSQVVILKTLLRNPNGLTREALADKSGVVVDNETLGPVYQETLTNHPDSLVAYRLVKVEKIDPTAPTLYKLTGGGIQAASMYSARKRGATDKVDPKALDKAVQSIRALKPYGLELFTEDDVKEVRELLPESEREVTVPSLRQQIVNRRKQGAYADNQIEEPAWYKEYRESHEFQVFASKVNEFYGGCAVCESTEGLTVYHRRFAVNGSSILAVERAKDGITLCERCRKRNGRFMCEIPQDTPEGF